MKKFFSEFKEFLQQGNALDLAVGVIIGGAFGAIVTALIDNLITPLIGLLGGGKEIGLAIQVSGQTFDFGKFISAIINFIIIAFVVFCIIKAANKAKEAAARNKEEEEEATTKICPFCKSEIAIDATKCPHCTSDQPEEVE